MPGELNSLVDCPLIQDRVSCGQRLQYVLLKAPIIGWRTSEPLPKWITLVANGSDLIMS